MSRDSCGEEDIKGVIRQMKSENSKIINNAMKDNLDTLYENLDKISDIMETNFDQFN